MARFTEDELDEIGEAFGLQRVVIESRPVRDGRVKKGDLIWWRTLRGPEHVVSDSGSHWENIKNYPSCYQHSKPTGVAPTGFIYDDEPA